MKAKIIIVLLLLALFTVFVSQNTKIVDVNFFFWRLEMSTIVLITFTFISGIILGFIIAAIYSSSGKKKKELSADKKKKENLGEESEVKQVNKNQF